ncbi:hypothetical protein SAMN04489729_1552 [Amycolatopsis lurida]|nr:hypothetical protein SAMN04489729_1552 [Amycolatopsis lurida]
MLPEGRACGDLVGGLRASVVGVTAELLHRAMTDPGDLALRSLPARAALLLKKPQAHLGWSRTSARFTTLPVG